MDSEHFTIDERTVEKEWQIYLNAIHPVSLTTHGDLLDDKEVGDALDDLDLIPESMTLNCVSFYFEGTYEEAYNAAEQMCRDLNENEKMEDSTWEFESGCIMIVDD